VIALALGVGLAGEQVPAMVVVSFPLILMGVACIMLRKSKA
jgi:hypothetical protein